MQLPCEEAYFDEIDRALSGVLVDDAHLRQVRLALRWFERGLRTRDNVDRVLSHFIGIEAILNSYASRNSPLPEYEVLETRFNDWLKTLAVPLDPAMEKWLRGGVVRTVLAEHFTYYADRHGWEAALSTQFRDMRRLRNGIAHGHIAVVSDAEADSVQRMLRKLLASELRITGDEPKSGYPDVRSLQLVFQYVDSGKQPPDSTGGRDGL